MADDLPTAEPGVAITHAERKRGLLFVTLAVAAVGFALALQMGMSANFLAEDMGLSGLQRGVVEAARETCGILAFLVLAVLAGLAEPVIAMAVLLVFGVGLGGYAFVPDYGWLIAASVVWSQGLHVWMPLPHSMAMALAEKGRSGHRLGQVRAGASAGFGLGIVAAFILTLIGVKMRPMYVIAAAFGILGGVICLGVPRRIKTPGPRWVFRRKYSLFYLLSFLEGWRKQIFLCFAGFLLVKVHGTPLWVMLVLMGGIQGICFVASPRMGRLIDRVGERPILVFYFACLTVFFVGYAFVTNPYVLYALYVIDSSFFVFAMALTTYAGRLAPPGERTATLSMGVAMNHVAAVAMPLLGGALWITVGHHWTFLAGAFAAALSVVVAMRVPSRGAPTPAEDDAQGVFTRD